MTFDKTGWIFAEVPITATCNPDISDGAYRLLVYLAWCQGSDGRCRASVRRMAADLGVSRSTIRRRLHELEGAGYVGASRRGLGRMVRVVLPDEDDGGPVSAPDADM